MKPTPISAGQFNDLMSNKKVITTVKAKPKVLIDDNQVLKCFYDKTKWAKNKFFPPSFRFVKNAERLHQLGVIAPMISAFCDCRPQRVMLVTYPKLAGQEVRACALTGDFSLFAAVAHFMARLHQKGIFFRAIHLANILTDADRFALIDISETRFYPFPLPLRIRARNLAHLLTHCEDYPLFCQYGHKTFINHYLATQNWPTSTISRFKNLLIHYFNKGLTKLSLNP